jgi:tRNA(Ile)-lysidine synthase
LSAASASTAGATVAVAFSGGRDSLALLHATAHAAARLGLRVVALHVHHGLVDDADAWVKSAGRLCTRWRRRGLPVQLRWARIASAPGAGESTEAWARRERYRLLTDLAVEEGAGLVLLAHHRRDQAETVLLQALRHAGPRGLAAMPVSALRGSITFARPWLDRPREAVEAYVRRHRLAPIEDPSNQDARWARNRLRLHVWPALSTAFADAELALAAVARRAQEADAALSELARQDLEGAIAGETLSTARISVLSAARQANALRAWLTDRFGHGPADTLVCRLRDEALLRRAGRWPVDVHREVVLHRGWLRVISGRYPIAGPALSLDLTHPGPVRPDGWGGTLQVVRTTAGGVPLAALTSVHLKPRSGGEQFQRAPKGIPRSLKKQYQSAGLAEHERGGPLLWIGDRLLFVPGLGIDARWAAVPGEPRVDLQWLPDRD